MSADTITPRHVLSAVIALAMTVAFHGGWLSGMDRDAVAVTAQQA